MKKSQSTSSFAAFGGLFVGLLSVVLLVLGGSVASAQTQRAWKKRPRLERMVPDTAVYEVCELMPYFKGGDKALMNYISTTTRYPPAAVKDKQQGRVLVRFIVEKDGSLTHFEVVRKVAAVLDAEALRVMKLMPKWVPGQQHGQFVRVRYVVPICFRLE